MSDLNLSDGTCRPALGRATYEDLGPAQDQDLLALVPHSGAGQHLSGYGESVLRPELRGGSCIASPDVVCPRCGFKHGPALPESVSRP